MISISSNQFAHGLYMVFHSARVYFRIAEYIGSLPTEFEHPHGSHFINNQKSAFIGHLEPRFIIRIVRRTE